MQPSESAMAIRNCRTCRRSKAKKRSGGTKVKQKRGQKEQKKETETLEQEKAREKVELGIKKTNSTKVDLQMLCSQLEKDFGNLMSKAAEENKSAHILAIETVSLKRRRDEKVKQDREIR